MENARNLKANLKTASTARGSVISHFLKESRLRENESPSVVCFSSKKRITALPNKPEAPVMRTCGDENERGIKDFMKRIYFCNLI